MLDSDRVDGGAGRGVPADLTAFVPVLRTDFVRRDIDGESVVWSSIAPEPTVLDPVASLMLDVVDGVASVAELAVDVHEEIGVPLETAERQVVRIVKQYESAGLLTSSTSGTSPEEAIAGRDLFVGSVTPCSENASRLGTIALNLRFGDSRIRVACDARRGARLLRSALADHVDDDPEDAPLGFVLTAPQGLRRSHSLVDRSGFVLSEGRGLDAGLHALASHLTAFLPPPPGTVRIRARALIAGERMVVCAFPLLYFPAVTERDLARAGARLVDRLALDVDVQTGEIANRGIPWPALGGLDAGRAHAGTGGHAAVAAVLTPGGAASAPPTRASVVATLAASGLEGSPAQLLDAATALTQRAVLRSVPPGADAVSAARSAAGSSTS